MDSYLWRCEADSLERLSFGSDLSAIYYPFYFKNVQLKLGNYDLNFASKHALDKNLSNTPKYSVTFLFRYFFIVLLIPRFSLHSLKQPIYGFNPGNNNSTISNKTHTISKKLFSLSSSLYISKEEKILK